MNLRHDEKKLRLAAQGLLAFIGLLLLGTGLALLSGVTHSRPEAATALVLLHQLPEPEPPSAPAPQFEESRTERYREAPAAEPPRDTRPPRAPRAQGRLAIVIDDIGHNAQATRRFLRLPYPITYSVLPALPHTRDSADLILRAGRQFLVHLPMEPFDYPRENPGPDALMLNQSVEEAASRVKEYLRELPEAIGANNHMGSAYTYDVAHMRVVQTVLAEHRLFFLNSKTSATPVPEQVARAQGYAYLERDVFLDNELNEASIERAFRQAVRQARAAGHAIAIGHPHPQTWRVLRRELPRLARQGVVPVRLSELLRH